MAGHSSYDVIVAGGGPAGLSAATATSRRGHSTLVLERSRVFGEPVHDSGGSFLEDIKELGIDDRLIATRIKGIDFIPPNGRLVSVNWGRDIGCVLERRELNKALARRAADAGVDIHLPERAKDPVMKNGSVCGVRTRAFGVAREYRSRVLVDATGVNAVCARTLGIHPGLDGIEHACGYQYEMSNVELDRPDHIQIYFGRDIAPSGYAWIFPKREGTANVGIGYFKGADARPGTDYLKRFVRAHPVASRCLKNARPLEFHSGIFPVGPMFSRSVRNGFLAVGDSSCQGSPHLGEGIRFVMRTGNIAGEVISDCLDAGDTSEKKISRFDTRVKKEVYPNYRLLHRMLKYVVSRSDGDWNFIISKIGEVGDTKWGKDIVRKVVDGSVSKKDMMTIGLRYPVKRMARIWK